MRPRIAVSISIFLAALCTGILAGFALLEQKYGHAEINLTTAHSELELALSTMSQRLTSMAKALERSDKITPDIYSSIYNDAAIAGLRVHERAMALMPEFETSEQAQAFVKRMSSQFMRAGYPDFEIFPSQETDVLFPALFVEPPAARHKVFGYNMASSTERMEAAREVLRTGGMKASAPVVLSQDADKKPSSFLLLVSVDLRGVIGPVELRQAFLGAGMTPAALFQNHIATDDRHILTVDVQIDDQTLPVVLGDVQKNWMPRIPLVQQRTKQSSVINGLEVSMTASVHYVPKVYEAALPVAVALLMGFVLNLLVKNRLARNIYNRNLEIALKSKEEQLLEAHRIHAATMRVEALGRLVGGVAHDFNNILGVILGNLELLRDKEKKDAERSLVGEAINATRRGEHLTRQLLSFGRKSHLQPRRIEVADALAESAQMLHRILPTTIDITLADSSGTKPIDVDPDGLQNAILNIALNARDAMEDRGKLVLQSTNERISKQAPEAIRNCGLIPGHYVKVTITDTGSGMAPEIVDHVFEPFFTTKPAAEGSGLGLSSVLGFCQQSGGTCLIESEPGVGTSLNLFFPVAKTDPIVRPAAATKVRPTPATCRILLAEDEDSIARVLIGQLEAAGHSVYRVNSGDAAWAELQTSEKYDLLISDIIMPGRLQGVDLARKVELEHPSVSILLISGYPQDASNVQSALTSRHPVMTKPFSKQELILTIDRLMYKPAST
ncbi:MAG: CHASE domain-containing protein [Pseudomonadota bacterium]